MYSLEGRVRYSEIGSNGELSLQSVLDYFQDASTFHSEDLGVGLEYLGKRNRVWLLSAWQIVAERYPKLGECIKIITFPYDFKGFIGFRNFYMEDKEGSKIAYANSIWTLMDLETMKPARVSDEMKEKYILSEKLPMEYAPRKIEITDRGEQKETIVIKNHHLDTNHHVNNGQYLRIAMDYLPAGTVIRQMRAEYKKSALLGDHVVPFIKKDNGRYTILLAREDSEIYAIIELNIS